MDGSAIADGLGALVMLAFIAVIIAILGIGYFCYDVFFTDKKTFKTETKPAITWELKAKGQKVDTVWIYKFK